MSNLKSNLREIPIELFDKIETILKEYGMENIEVTGIDVTSKMTEQLVEGPTEEECAKEGKKQKCKKKANGTVKCWCVKR